MRVRQNSDAVGFNSPLKLQAPFGESKTRAIILLHGLGEIRKEFRTFEFDIQNSFFRISFSLSCAGVTLFRPSPS